MRARVVYASCQMSSVAISTTEVITRVYKCLNRYHRTVSLQPSIPYKTLLKQPTIHSGRSIVDFYDSCRPTDGTCWLLVGIVHLAAEDFTANVLHVYRSPVERGDD